MEEHGITFNDYGGFFSNLDHEMFNSANKKLIALLNYKIIILAKGTIDIFALPKK